MEDFLGKPAYEVMTYREALMETVRDLQHIVDQLYGMLWCLTLTGEFKEEVAKLKEGETIEIGMDFYETGCTDKNVLELLKLAKLAEKQYETLMKENNISEEDIVKYRESDLDDDNIAKEDEIIDDLPF